MAFKDPVVRAGVQGGGRVHESRGGLDCTWPARPLASALRICLGRFCRTPARLPRGPQGRRQEGRRQGACSRRSRHGGDRDREADMPVILVAPGTVEPFANVAVKTRVDGQIVEVAFKEGDLVNEKAHPVSPRRPAGEGADRPGGSEHRQGPGQPARCRGDAGAARGADRQEDRDRGRARPGALCRRGAEGQHRRRHGAARSRRRPSSTISPSARRSPAAPAASAPSSAPWCAASGRGGAWSPSTRPSRSG